MPKPLTIKDKTKELKLFKRRIIVITTAIILMALGLIARLVYLQIYQHERFTTLSEENQLTLIPIEPPRGLIYDRNGIALAENRPIYSLDLIPDRVKSVRDAIQHVSELIAISDDNIHDFYKNIKQRRRYEPIPLKLNLTEDEIARFATNQWRYPGLTTNAHLLRYYPWGTMTAHSVGYMGRINEQEQEQIDENNYSASNYIGKNGLEKFYEPLLHGTVGFQQAETDASGRIIRVLKRTPPIAGANLYLSLDAKLQLITEQAFGDTAGAAVAIEPGTGQVLAFVSHPGFDANLFVQGINPTTYKALQSAKQRPLNNRALRGVYPPGSTIKPFYGLAGLQTKVVDPSFVLFDPGYFVFGNHTYRDWNFKKGGHGRVDLHKAIVISCDTYFFTLATRQGIDRMARALRNFGFGQLTGIDMTDEVSGLVPTPDWKKRRYNMQWFMGDTISAGIGQGYLNVTPLELAVAVATIANNGIHLQPRLVAKIKYPDGHIITPPPIALTEVKAKPHDWKFIQTAMHDVISAGTGGAHYGKDAAYSVAGKTGTAQVFSLRGANYNANQLPLELRDNSLFIVYAPMEHPRIAVAVIAEHTKEAGDIARKMIDYYLLKKIPNDKQTQPNSGASTRTPH